MNPKKRGRVLTRKKINKLKRKKIEIAKIKAKQINLLDLPDEILLLIAEYVANNTSREMIEDCKVVCRHFCNIFSDTHIRKIYDRYFWLVSDCITLQSSGSGMTIMAPYLLFHFDNMLESSSEFDDDQDIRYQIINKKNIEKKKKKEKHNNYRSYQKRNMPKSKFTGR